PNRVSNRAPATARRNPASPTGTKPGRTWSPSQTTPTAAGTAVSPTTTAAVVTVTAPRCRPVAKNRKAISAPPTNAYVAGSAIRRPGEAEAHHRHGGPVPRPQPGPEHRYRDQRGHRQVGRHRRLYQEDRYQSQCEELQPEPDHVQRQAGDERYLPGKPQQQARVHVGGVRSGAGGHCL